LTEYGHLLQDDSQYAEKARRISELAVDLSEIISTELKAMPSDPGFRPGLKIAFQSPCTLQHGQKLAGKVEDILRAHNYTLLPVSDGHLCCGSAGTYSVLQPTIAKQLKADKLHNQQDHTPNDIETANIG